MGVLVCLQVLCGLYTPTGHGMWVSPQSVIQRRHLACYFANGTHLPLALTEVTWSCASDMSCRRLLISATLMLGCPESYMYWYSAVLVGMWALEKRLLNSCGQGVLLTHIEPK